MAQLQGDDEGACSYAEQALTAGRWYGGQSIEAAALTNRGHAFVGLGRRSDAMADYQAARAILEPLGYRDAAGEPQTGLAWGVIAGLSQRLRKA